MSRRRSGAGVVSHKKDQYPTGVTQFVRARYPLRGCANLANCVDISYFAQLLVAKLVLRASRDLVDATVLWAWPRGADGDSDAVLSS
jgi:hypothetical protein